MARAGQREGLLADLCAPGALDVVCSLLVSSREVRIAVPCAVLSTSKGAGSSSGVGSRVVISVLRRGPGTSLAIDCGRWWRGAPPGAVLMDAAEVRRALCARAQQGFKGARLNYCIGHAHFPC